MLFPRGQKITFRGRRGNVRALEFASDLGPSGAEVEGGTVVLKKDTDIGDKNLGIVRESLGESLGAIEFGANGQKDARRL